MKQDIERLALYYRTDCIESNRVTCDRTNRLEEITTLRYLNTIIPKGSSILDACAGYGIYAFPLAESGYKVTAGDIVSHHVSAIKERQQENPVLQEVYQGSMIDLSRFGDGSFDAVLNLGAYYHITDKAERYRTIYESKRVLRSGGLIFVAYLNKYSNFVKFCDSWTTEVFNIYLKRGYTDDDSLFYATTPEDIENELKDFGFEIIRNIATDGVKYVYRKALNDLPEDLYHKFLTHHFEMCERRSLLGYSEHALLIGRK